jgi:hypothetical protein
VPTNYWYNRVDITALGDDARRLILEKVKHKLEFTRALEALDVSKGATHNYLHGAKPGEVVYRALQHLEEGEFKEIARRQRRTDARGDQVARKPRRYDWVEKIIEKGLPDGGRRFILYVLSAYLVNVKRLSEEEALQVVQEFLENSCRSHGSYGKIYESFIRGDLRRVKSKDLRPVSLERLRERPRAVLANREDPSEQIAGARSARASRAWSRV